jgi:hypothetical protein
MRRQALLIAMLVVGWLMAVSSGPVYGQHQCGTIGRASATSGQDKEHLQDAMEAYNQDRAKVCDKLCKERRCEGEKGPPCRAIGDDADATCSLGRDGWKCSDSDFNCKCTCDPTKEKDCPDREVAANDSSEAGCKTMAEFLCKSACEKGKCRPTAENKKVQCEPKKVDVVCKKAPALWYDEKVLCDCHCPEGPDRED